MTSIQARSASVFFPSFRISDRMAPYACTPQTAWDGPLGQLHRAREADSILSISPSITVLCRTLCGVLCTSMILCPTGFILSGRLCCLDCDATPRLMDVKIRVLRGLRLEKMDQQTWPPPECSANASLGIASCLSRRFLLSAYRPLSFSHMHKFPRFNAFTATLHQQFSKVERHTNIWKSEVEPLHRRDDPGV